MIKRIDHIGIAVPNMEEALSFFQDALGLDVSRVGTEVEQRSTVAFMPVSGCEVELIEPIGEEGPIAKFLGKRGEGIHHICFEVDDIQAETDRLKARGVELTSEQPYVVGGGGKKAIFIHPKSAHGVLIELYQTLDAGDVKPTLTKAAIAT